MSNSNVMYIFTVEIKKSGFTSIVSVEIDSFMKINTTEYISIDKLLKMMKLYDANVKTTCHKLNIDYDMVDNDAKNIRGMMIRQMHSNSEGLFGVTTDIDLNREGLQRILDMHYEDGTIEDFLNKSYIGIGNIYSFDRD
ncbi:hypothetical protein PBI_SCTP2_321 [Salicola phage SCTP-2]|nr:hypothetical protein PBI_SCTP2_321 [Salicola phage SCTP-2]